MTDNYEFAKSCLPQGVATETPYVSKQWGYVNDINSGVYSNTGLTLVQFDLSSIYNSTQLIDPSQMYITVPITYVSAYTTSSALTAPVTGGWSTTGLKQGYYQLLHGADLVVNGKTVEQFQPNLNAYVNFKLLSQMSQDDLKTLGASLGMGEALDNPESMIYNGSGTSTATGTFPASGVPTAGNGNGMTNNQPFPISGTADFGDQGAIGGQFTGAYNQGYFSRLKKVADTATGIQNLFGTGSATTNITNVSNLQKEFRPYYTVLNTNYAVWYDVAVIRMQDVFDSMKNFPLMKKFDGILRLYLNTGTVVSNVTGSAGLMITSASSNTFTNTCPLIQSAVKSLPSSVVSIASGLFIANPIATSIVSGGATVNFASAGASHFMTACRMYYPQVTLKPEKLIPYISENRSKKICYTSVLTNTFNAISAGSTVSYLVQSGVTNIRGVLIIPLLASSTNGTISSYSSVTPFSQLISPFDTAPATTAPISLLNLQVAIGGVNVLQNTLNYSYEDFLQQVLLYEKINAGDMGISCGLINQNYWENAYRAYYVDCSRANIADLMTPRNVNVTFTNNSLQSIDCLIFTEYFKEITVDVETGLVNV